MSRTDEDISTNINSDHASSSGVDPFVGKELGKYLILDRVAKGGTATVYKAKDRVLNREVAVKILHEHLEQKREVVERFKNEAQVVASLRHPNVLNVYDFFTHQDRTVLVAEFMPGSTLSALIKGTRRLPEKYVLMLGLEMLNGLRAAHEKGITHRDIKPANILIHPELGVKISDFGLAKLKDVDTGLTREGVFIGTPSFSSPEQIEGRPIDHRSDLFSMGLTIYMLATGAHAFKQKGDSTTTVWFKIVRGKFQAVREIDSNISPDLEKILSRALQVDLDKRYQTAKQMADDILALLKKMKAYPYQDELKAFLEKPVSAAAPGTMVSKKKFIGVAAAVFVLALAIAALLAWQRGDLKPVQDWWAERNVRSIESPKAPAPSVTSPQSPPTGVPAAPAPSTSQPIPAESRPELALPKNEPAPKPARSPLGLKQEPYVLVADSSKIIFHRDRRDFNLRFVFEGDQDFSIARASSAGRKIFEGRFRSGGVDWKNWSVGKFVWKAGSKSGEFELIDWEQYRSRSKAVKKELLVSSAYAETDLQINPWTEILRLSWDSGASADSYRLEIAEDAEFKKSIYAGTSLSKFSNIDRLFHEDITLFWRVSYLDSNRNVFLVDPVRKINLKVMLSASQFALISPQAYDSIVNGQVSVEAVGPSDVKARCGEVGEAGAKSLVPLASESGLLKAQVKLRGDLFYCEAMSARERLAFVLPLQQ
jgi:serine/threonine protein kinase